MAIRARSQVLAGAVLLVACGSSARDEGQALVDRNDTAGRTWDTRLVHVIHGGRTSLAVEPDGAHRIAYTPSFTHEVRTLSSDDDAEIEPSLIATSCDQPSIAAHPVTRSAVVCRRSFEIFAVRLNDAPVRVTQAPTVEKSFPRAAFDSKGVLHVVYREEGADPGVGYASLAEDGTTTHAPVARGLDNVVTNLALTITRDDAVHVVFGVHGHGVHHVRRDPAGTWGPDELISAPDADAFAVDVASDESGTLHVLYVDDDTPDFLLYHPRLRYLRGTVRGWGEVQTLVTSEDLITGLSLHVRPDGRVSIAFTRQRADDHNELWFLPGNDGTFDRAGVIQTATPAMMREPIVTTDGDDLLVLYNETDPRGHLRLARLVP